MGDVMVDEIVDNDMSSCHHLNEKRRKVEHVMRQLGSTSPSVRKGIEELLGKLTRTPDHPPYASMIQMAITELKNQGGSSEEAILKFIEAHYVNLSIIHPSMLTHHLEKLVTKGEIVRTSPDCYMLPLENSDFLPKSKQGQKHLRRGKQVRRNGRREHKIKGDEVEESNIVEMNNEVTEAEEEGIQLADLQIEAVVEQIHPEEQHLEMREEEKGIQERQMEVCSQIADLSNMLNHFIQNKIEKEDKSSMSNQNYISSQKVDLFASSHLTTEEFMELLRETNKIGGKLTDIVSSLNMEGSYNTLKSRTGVKELVEDHLVQVKNPRDESVSVLSKQLKQQQQPDICCQLEVSESQPKTISTSVNVPTDLMQLEWTKKIEFLSCKRPPEVEIATLELYQQKASQAKPKSVVVPMNSEQIEHREQADHSKPINPLNLDLQFPVSGTPSEHTEKLSSELQLQTTSSDGVKCLEYKELEQEQQVILMEQLPSDFLQQSTSGDGVKGHENKEIGQEQQPENPIVEPIEHEVIAVEQPSQKQEEEHHQMKLQPLSQKQSGQTKLIQYQRMRRLRHRDHRPSENGLSLTTVKANPDMTLASLKSELKQKTGALIRKRSQEPETKTMFEIYPSAEQQVNHNGHKKRLKPQPTTITTVGPAITSQQQAKRKTVQRQLRPQGQGRLQSKLVVQKTIEEPLSLEHKQRQQKKPKLERRGRPPKLKSVVGTTRRPPKQKTNADATMEASLLSDHKNHNEEQPQSQGRGRKGQGRPPKSKSSTAIGTSLPSQHQSKHQRQQPQGRRLGRPPKSVPVTAKNIPQQKHQANDLGKGKRYRARAAETSIRKS